MFESHLEAARALKTEGRYAELARALAEIWRGSAEAHGAKPEVLWASMRSPMREALHLAGAVAQDLRAHSAFEDAVVEMAVGAPVLAVALAADPRTPGGILARTRDGVVAADPSPASTAFLDALARNPSASAPVLAALLERDRARFGSAVAANRSTASEVLAALAKAPEIWIRDAAAGNPSTPVATLRELAASPTEAVRALVAGNPSTPEDVLQLLVKDRALRVRTRVVARLPKELLGAWLASQDEGVRHGLAANAHTPSDVLRRLADAYALGSAPDAAGEMRIWLASNPSCPAPLLEQLAEDPGSDNNVVRAKVAANPAAPQALLAKLAHDRVDNVYNAALANPSLDAEWLRAFVLENEGKLRRRVTKEDPMLVFDRRLSPKLLAAAVVHAPFVMAVHPRVLLEDLCAAGAAAKPAQTKRAPRAKRT